MEILGERPVWSMSDSEQLATLDALQAEVSRLQTYRLQVLAGYDASGHAATLGAGDTARLLAFRHRLDPGVIKRDLALAKALPKYPAITNALPPTPVGDPVDTTPDQPDSEPVRWTPITFGQRTLNGNPVITSTASAPPTPMATIASPPALGVWLSVPIIIPPGKA